MVLPQKVRSRRATVKEIATNTARPRRFNAARTSPSETAGFSASSNAGLTASLKIGTKPRPCTAAYIEKGTTLRFNPSESEFNKDENRTPAQTTMIQNGDDQRDRKRRTSHSEII